MKTKVILLFVVVSCFSVAFTPMSITGMWVGHLVRPNSTDTATFIYTLQQTNDALTGTITGPDGKDLDIDSGKVSGNNYSFIITEAYGKAKISGTYYGDSLSTNVALPSKTLHFTLLRSK